MAIGRTWPAIGRAIVLLTLASALLFASALSDRKAWAQQPAAEASSVESIKKSLDQIEEALGGDDITPDTLAGFRQTLNSAMDALRAKIEELEPRVQEAQERLQQLGPAPAKDAPAESPEMAKEREEHTTQFSELDG